MVIEHGLDEVFVQLGAYMESIDLRGTKRHIKRKEGRDIVTDMDLLIERGIVNIIRRRFPDHNILSEESSYSSTDSPYIWMIDPIDGTVNYSKGYPFYAISIALMYSNAAIQAMVYVGPCGKVYSARKGQGAYCNEKRLAVSKTARFEDSLVSVMLTSHYTLAETKIALQAIERTNMAARGVRVMVCEAAELCFIAEGILDASVVCVKADPYGSMAGQLILEESGGQLTELNGEVFGVKSRTILATNRLLHNNLLNLYADI